MTKYHISEDGNPRPCRASKNPCRFGGEGSHYDSMFKAREGYEQKQVIDAFKAKPAEEASLEAFASVIKGSNWTDRVGNGIDLPNTPNSRAYRKAFDNGILTGNVQASQEALKAWLAEAEEKELNDGWKKALANRSVFTRSIIDADPKALESFLDKNYLRPHAVNPQDSSDVRGALVAKAPGWQTQGAKLVHDNGMTLSMTPGYADRSGWSIDGPAGWRDKYFEGLSPSAGLYPLGDRDLLDSRCLNGVASYAP